MASFSGDYDDVPFFVRSSGHETLVQKINTACCRFETIVCDNVLMTRNIVAGRSFEPMSRNAKGRPKFGRPQELRNAIAGDQPAGYSRGNTTPVLQDAVVDWR